MRILARLPPAGPAPCMPGRAVVFTRMLSLHQIYKSYGRQQVLAGVSMQVNPGERVGLVGPNGAGKSTILGLMLGQGEPDSGEVFRAKSLRLGYLPQDLVQLSGQTVLELALDSGQGLEQIEAELEEVHRDLAAGPSPDETQELLERQGRLLTLFEGLGGYQRESEARKVLAGLGFKDEQVERDVSELSGGWLMRAALARILLSAPEVILLDEPTNHLDLESLLWLEGQLTASPAALVLVSHDRVFMDKVCNRIVEVEHGQLYTYGGNYSQYQEQRLARRKAQEAAYLAQQERIREINRFIERNRSRKDRASQVQGRIKMLEKMERLVPPTSDNDFHLELPACDRSAKVVVELEDVDLSYDEHQVYKGLNFMVQRGDRLALLGRNGEGKSSLLKLLAGQVRPQGGRRLVGGRVKTGIFSQHALENLSPDNTALEELGSVAGLMALSSQRTLLGTFLFKGDDVFKKVRVLSGGERSRLVLAKLFITAPNFLLLDEPTNHLDITGRMVLEQALRRYDGTLVLISHDRHLINAVARKVAHVEGGMVQLFPGNFDDFFRLWRKKAHSLAQERPQAAPAAPALASAPDLDAKGASGPKTPAQKRVEAEARNALHRKLKPLKDEFAKVEKEVEKTSARLDQLVAQMVDPQAYQDSQRWGELSQKHDKVKAQLNKLTARWEKLALQLEEEDPA